MSMEDVSCFGKFVERPSNSLDVDTFLVRKP